MGLHYTNGVPMNLLAFTVMLLVLPCSCAARSPSSQDGQDHPERPAQAIQPVSTGHGATGPYSMRDIQLENRHWSDEPIHVFMPQGTEGKRPTLFFSHAFGATSWTRGYADLMPHLVSQGYIVVYVPYKTMRATMEERYATLWDGFLTAVQRHGESMDLSRVGFIGHSFGGGATPAMAYKGLVEKGWGKAGAFIFIMAPWYSFEISQEQLQEFPADTRLTIQVYDRDTVNDHRMAIDLFNNIDLAAENKSFQVIRSHAHGEDEAIADHVLPGKNPSLALKSWGVFRQLDALADYVFTGDPEAKKIAAGQGSAHQTEMGKWMDGTAYPPILVSADPIPAQPEGHYEFPWSNAKHNQRLSPGEPSEPAPESGRRRLRDRLRGN